MILEKGKKSVINLTDFNGNTPLDIGWVKNNLCILK